MGFPPGSDSKASACNAGDYPWVGKIPLEKQMETHSSTLACKIPGQRSLVGYSPWGRKESDMTEQLHIYQ